MHVNGAPPMMQPPMQGGVPAPGQMPTSVPGPNPLAPGGEFSSVCLAQHLPSIWPKRVWSHCVSDARRQSRLQKGGAYFGQGSLALSLEEGSWRANVSLAAGGIIGQDRQQKQLRQEPCKYSLPVKTIHSLTS